jgi:CRISPR-associated endoribonuclease Cas6
MFIDRIEVKILRLQAKYKINGPIPLDYRQGFMSLIKESLKSFSEKEYEKYFIGRKGRNIVFNCFFGNNMKINKTKEVIIPEFSTIMFEISSPDSRLIAMIYNGLKKKNKFPLFEMEIELISIRQENKTIGNRNTVLVSSLSPIIIKSSPENGSKYILPGDQSFYESLNHFCRVKYEDFFKQEFSANVNLNPRKLKRVVIKHMGTYHTGFKGIFELSSTPKMIQFLYDAGIGTRTAQGFGMLDLIT